MPKPPTRPISTSTAKPAPKRGTSGVRGFFSGLAQASATGARAPFVNRAGVHLIRLKRVDAGANRSNMPYFHVDLKVEHKISDGTISDEVMQLSDAAVRAGKPALVHLGGHEAGESLAWRVKVHGEWVELQLGNVKNFCEAVIEGLGLEVPEFEDEDEAGQFWDDLIFDDADGIASEAQPAAGLLLVMTSEIRPTKKGGVIVVCTFTAGEDVAADLVAKGVLDESILA